MQKIFTTEFIKANCGCYTPEKLLDVYKENKDVPCYETPSCNVTLEEILDSSIPLKDKFWFICKKIATKEQNQQIVIEVAEIVLPIYENKYPKDLRPREAIEAAKLYIVGHISLEELRNKRNAAAYAAYAANAADAAAAYAAAYAAYAADAAAYAAAYAAHAAADAAANAATYAGITEKLLQYLKDFCK
jgi:hypothetical protein